MLGRHKLYKLCKVSNVTLHGLPKGQITVMIFCNEKCSEILQKGKEMKKLLKPWIR